MPILHNIKTAFTCAESGGQAAVHAIDNAALVWEEDRIEWIGPEHSLPAEYRRPQYTQKRINAGERILIPGLIDTCTQPAFGGWPDHILNDRFGYSGPKNATIADLTRRTSEIKLTQQTYAFLQKMMAAGVTTADCKSGTALNRKDELKLLKVFRTLKQTQQIELVTGFFGASGIPPEYRDRRNDYIRLLTQELIPYVSDHKLAAFCDVLLDDDGFTADEAITILSTGIDYGLKPRLHTDHHKDMGGARIAADLGVVSVSHLEAVSENGITALAESGIPAVALPQISLRQRKAAMPARRLIDSGVPIAVASGFNPNSAPGCHLPYVMSLACSTLNLQAAEVLKATTIYAAKALGLDQRLGSLEAGKQADFVLLDAPSLEQWLYHSMTDSCAKSCKAGQEIYEFPNK
jgi:imidazolonepropionase